MTHTFRNLTWFVAIGLISAFGCTDKTPEEDVKPASKVTDAGVQEPTKTADDVPLETPDVPEIPPPKVVGTREIQFDNPDDSRVVCEVKYFSDDTTLNHGSYTLYYPTDKKWKEGVYLDGKKSGEWTTWFENGTVAKIGPYKDDLPDGQFIVWRPDGSKEREEAYKAGQRHGRWVFYTPSGKPRKQEEYQFGKPDGTWIDWYSEKIKRQVRNYREGQLHGTQTNWSEEGTLRAQSEMREGQLHGTTIKWDQNGEKISELRYKNNSLVTEDASDD